MKVGSFSTSEGPPLTRARLLEILDGCQKTGKFDPESAHSMADDALIEYIYDDEIAKAFYAIIRWYS